MLWRVVLVAVSEHHSDIRCKLTPTHVLPSIHLFLQWREGEGERLTTAVLFPVLAVSVNCSVKLLPFCLSIRGQSMCKAATTMLVVKVNKNGPITARHHSLLSVWHHTLDRDHVMKCIDRPSVLISYYKQWTLWRRTGMLWWRPVH